MALTRSYLKSMGLTDEQVNAIIENHTEVTEALKKERDGYKTKAEAADAVTKERDELKGKLAEAEKAGGDADKVKAEFDAYKKAVETEKTNAGKKSLVRKALEDAGANPAALELLMSTVALDKVEIEGDKLKDVDAVLTPIKEAHAGLFGKKETHGTDPLTPPGGKGSPKTREEIYKKDDKGRYVYDTAERQKALAEIMASES